MERGSGEKPAIAARFSGAALQLISAL